MASQQPERPLLCAEAVTKLFPSGRGAVMALDHVNFMVTAGEFVALTGKSGSGKSTLLHLLGGLDWPSSGRVLWRGQSLADFRRKDLAIWRGRHAGFVFQTFNLIPTLTALENIEMPLILAGVSSRERRVRALELIHQVGLSQQAEQMPPTLSGGEQQRVALARALAADPEIILADEPTGNLDSDSAKVILDLLTGLHERGKTVILATHDPIGAARAGRVLHLRDGRLVPGAG